MKRQSLKLENYEEAYKVAARTAKKSSRTPFPYVEKSKLIEALQLTPGQFYSPGTTFEDILERMTNWGWLAKVEYKKKVYYVPQKREKWERCLK